jgi:hypothetical protein
MFTDHLRPTWQRLAAPLCHLPAVLLGPIRARRRAGTAAAVLLVLGLLAGCAGYSPSSVRPGDTEAEVLAVMGAPTGRYGQPAQAKAGVVKRLEFARGPYGRHTYMLDFDANNRLVRWKQVLTEARFTQIPVGLPQQQLLETLGRPGDVRRVRYQGHTIWSYRYENPFCLWYEVSIDRQGRVAETGNGPDPLCERERSFPF